MTHIIDGKAIAKALREEIAKETAQLVAKGVTPGLAVVIVGDDPASHVYVKSKATQTVEVGMASFKHVLDEATTQADLLALIARLNEDPAVDGILVQLPLPSQIDAETVLHAILPAKDVDGFHPVNVGQVATGSGGIAPCTPFGAMKLIKSFRDDLSGLHAVVVGRSNIVGKPMVQLLLEEHCTVTVVHSRTQDVAALVRAADIVIAAVGRPEMIKGDWIKPGAIVIDVGINRITTPEGKSRLVGDVAYEEAARHAAAITPVPGGVGPMTIASLLANTLQAAKARLG
ncbi:bifunctional methylenetetrahydrofolate dehydrogenase/methenyltetrahydrofolate cyclohydrolase FolD [Novosphingobium terrae]|uniref:bifunctional methylenetetrahydrofolate dehydrogenase/methenyltetrahydrofolate cyclohydrolase FolD n=1 Tax=Novosphingobium terrae TaxID=2726189 RepID=UPI00197D4758|nr:bifunctional methylenetetrahydrofolate dehydrogenase/methenyltetrahydrofolate cyclohydrolase FolD [Novosphingobium terrae]